MTALPLIAALAWTVALVVDSRPLSSTGALLSGVGLLSIATIAVVGLTVTGGRWSHRLAVASVAATLILAAIRQIDGFWLIGVVASVLAGSVLFLPGLTGRIRRLPAATGPPPSAVLLPLILLALPFPLGLLAGRSEPWAILTIGLSAPLFAFLFSRVVPGGLIGVRAVWPVLAMALTPMLSLTAGALTTVSVLAVIALAWRSEVKNSFHPARETGSAYPIPPELAPKDILDAARLDDRGRPK